MFLNATIKSLVSTLCIVLLLSGTLPVQAQTRPAPLEGQEWWGTVEGCMNATAFVYYYPRTSSSRTAPAGLVLGGLSREACVKMPLPEINVPSGWVRQQAGAPYYFRNDNGQLVPAFRKECLNDAIEISYLPEKTGVPGPQGPRGADGRDGQNGRDGARGPRGLRGMACPECSLKVSEQTGEKIFLSAGHPPLQEDADFKSAKVFVRLAGQKDPKVLFSSENEKEFWEKQIPISVSDLSPGEHILTMVVTYLASADDEKCVISCSVKVKVPLPKAAAPKKKSGKTGLVIGLVAAGAGVGLAVALGGGKKSSPQPGKTSTGIFVP